MSETANAPIPGAYATSPLAQIAGLGALFASGSGGTSAASGLMNTLFGKDFSTGSGGVLGGLKDWWNSSGSSDFTPGVQPPEEAAYSESLGDFPG